MTTLTEPGMFQAGIYPDMPEHVYHADPVPGGSLSSTGARKLLPPSCPARFRHEQDHPPVSDAFDFGSAAHRLVLGAGQPIRRLSHDDWRTKAAKDARDEARRQGYIPVLEADFQRVEAMAAAIREHPIASVLLSPENGHAEQSLFWPADDIWKRARVDWLPDPVSGARMILADYKTTVSADPRAIARSVERFGYHQQAAWYLEGARALGLCENPAFLFIFQEKTPPYLVTVCELSFEALTIGDALNRRAAEIYRDCQEAGAWPGYSADIELISLPAWAARGDYL